MDDMSIIAYNSNINQNISGLAAQQLLFVKRSVTISDSSGSSMSSSNSVNTVAILAVSTVPVVAVVTMQ